LKKTKYWWRNGRFTFSPEVKVYLLIDSPMAQVKSMKKFEKAKKAKKE